MRPSQLLKVDSLSRTLQGWSDCHRSDHCVPNCKMLNHRSFAVVSQPSFFAAILNHRMYNNFHCMSSRYTSPASLSQ